MLYVFFEICSTRCAALRPPYQSVSQIPNYRIKRPPLGYSLIHLVWFNITLLNEAAITNIFISRHPTDSKISSRFESESRWFCRNFLVWCWFLYKLKSIFQLRVLLFVYILIRHFEMRRFWGQSSNFKSHKLKPRKIHACFFSSSCPCMPARYDAKWRP